MTGERDLTILLRDLAPARRPGRFVFTSVVEVPAGVAPVVTVVEDEGITLVLPQGDADRLGLPYDLVLAMITLRVHSALDAVGLTAAVATALAGAGISANVVAGHVHDHVFVPVDDAGAAMDVLARLAAGST